MDIFGKQKPKSSFQQELDAKMRERKSLGLGADLTETEDEISGGNGHDSDDGEQKLASLPIVLNICLSVCCHMLVTGVASSLSRFH